jgi:hypothetical protein
MPVTGTWFGLPDFGITEKLGIGTPNANLYPKIGPESGLTQKNLYANNYVSTNPNLNKYASGIQQPQAQVLSNKTTANTGSGSMNNLTNDMLNDVRTGQEEDWGIVQQEYDNALNALAGEESFQRGNFGNMQAQAMHQGQVSENRLTEGRDAALDAAGQQEVTARETEASGLSTVRNLFRDIQQQNIADLSARGISSSSVAEALAERLGVETMKRIGDITGDTQTVINNIAKEKTRVVQVFNSKKEELWQGVDLQIQDIQNKLSYALNQISTQRGQAALQKQQARTDIAQQARSMINQIKQSAFEYEQKMAQEAARRQQGIDSAMQLLTFNEKTGMQELNPRISQSMTALQQANPGLGWQPQVNVQNGAPVVTGFGGYQPQKELDPFEAALIAKVQGQQQ